MFKQGSVVQESKNHKRYVGLSSDVNFWSNLILYHKNTKKIIIKREGRLFNNGIKLFMQIENSELLKD